MRDLAPPERTGRDEDAQGARERPDAHSVLGNLFPEPAIPTQRTPGRRALIVMAQVVAVVLGVVLLLERVPGLPSWDGIFEEDYWKFLPQALQYPWHLFISYGGYEQLLPRVIAQVATYFPLAQASRVFAVSGALVAAGCGLFIFHASAGHVRSAMLRALLGAGVVLMPVALLEIADCGVNSPWYLLPAAFWALLWRPRTRTGAAMAALVAFAAAASEILMALFLPLVVARLYVLRRPREHAASAGWLAGCMVQAPMVMTSYLAGTSRLNRRPGTLGSSLAFYAHDVVLPAFGWHLSWRLQSFAGRNGATVLVAIMLAVIVGAIFISQPGNRPFVVTAVLAGLVFCVFSTTLTPNAINLHPVVSPDLESGARYTVLPIFLFEAVAVVGVDYLLTRRRDGGHRRLANRLPAIGLRPAMAVSALVIVLAGSWVADFRYSSPRSESPWNWAPIVAKWQHYCEHSRTGVIVVKTGPLHPALPCDRLH